MTRRLSIPSTISISFTRKSPRIKNAGRRLGDLWPRFGRARDTYAYYGAFEAQSTRTDGTTPLLAATLATALASRLGLSGGDEVRFRDRFVAAVAAMDRADLRYLRTIYETLPVRNSIEVFTVMAAFRRDVQAIRERTRARIGELYERSGQAYGSFDPIEPYTPPTAGLTHADGSRIATFADGARSEVAALRTRVNASIVASLAPPQTQALLDAKRARREAFATALADGAAADVRRAREDGEAAKRFGSELLELADGWY